MDLSRADTAIFLSMWFNPETIVQALGRLRRGKDTKTIRAIALVAENTVQERIAEILITKSKGLPKSHAAIVKALMGEK